MKFAKTGAVLSEGEQPPRSNIRNDAVLKALRALENVDAELQRLDRQYEDIEKERQEVLAAARSEAARIRAEAEAEANRIKTKWRTFMEVLGPQARQIADG